MKNILLILLALGYLPLLFITSSVGKDSEISDSTLTYSPHSSQTGHQSKTERDVTEKKTVQNQESHPASKYDAEEGRLDTNSESIRFALNDVENTFDEKFGEVITDFLEDVAPWDMSEQASQELSEQYASIELTRMKAQALLDELEFQKQDYDDQIKETLGEPAYEDYLVQQKDKFLSTYITDLESFASDSNVKLNGKDIEKIKVLLSEIDGGVTVDQSSGPYGKPPASALAQHLPGSFAEKYFNDDRGSLLKGELDYLEQSIQDRNLQKVLQAYYGEKINHLE